MRKVLAILAICAGAMSADVIRFHGTVTSAPANAPIQTGDTFIAWAAFEVVNNANHESWTPGDLWFGCNKSPSCAADIPTNYTVFPGSRGITYNSGHSWTQPGFGGDVLSLRLSSNLMVVTAQTSGGGLVAGYNSIGSPCCFEDYHSGNGDGYGTIYGYVSSAEFVPGIPEPSTLLLSAPVLLLWGHRRIRARRSADEKP